MKIVTILLLAVTLSISVAMAQYPVVPIDSLQWAPCWGDSSRYAGDTVTTGGIITAGTGLFYAGTGVTCYLSKPDGGLFSGVMLYNTNPQGLGELYRGDSILFNAIVSEYGWEPSPGAPFVTHTELLVIPGSFQYRLYGMPEPPPVIINAIEIDSTGRADSCGEKYESAFVQINDLYVDSVVNYTSTSTWICHDATGKCLIREASDSIPNSFRPTPGTHFNYIKGVIYHRFGALSLQPRYSTDWNLAEGPPIVNGRTHIPAYPILGDSVRIIANAYDNSAIDTVRLYYRINLGTWVNVPMVSVGSNNFQYVLPSPVNNWDVDYYVRAVDDENNSTFDPNEAPSSFYSYRVQQYHPLTIAQARVDANGDFVPDMLDSAVTLTGIAVSPNFSPDKTDFFMQQGLSGIDVYYDSTQITINPGDSITVSGIISQYTGKTQVVVYKRSLFVHNGFGTLPTPMVVNCADLGDINGESLEGTLVKVVNANIYEIPDPWPGLGFSATMTIANGADSAALRIDRNTDIDGQPQSQPKATITGVVGQYDNYAPYLGYYQLMPRFYTDFEWITGSVCNYTVGDANGNGSFNGLDVTYSVNYFKGGAPPSYSCECPPGNTWFVSGDVNNSCSFNGLDVTYMVNYFKGGAAPNPCATCLPGLSNAPNSGNIPSAISTPKNDYVPATITAPKNRYAPAVRPVQNTKTQTKNSGSTE